MDIDTQDLSSRKLQPAESELVERARKALLTINRSFEMKLTSTSVTQTACALVYFSSGSQLMLDFMAHEPGEIGQAFLGPQVALTPDLFEGETFTSDFLRQMEVSFEAFNKYCLEER